MSLAARRTGYLVIAMKKPSLLVILGNQLFAPDRLPLPDEVRVFMAEDFGLCTYERHHQQKIVLFLAAMRTYADELREAGYEVDYAALDPADQRSYEEKLELALRDAGVERMVHFEVEDKAMERRLRQFAAGHGLKHAELRSPMFTCTRQDFADWNSGRARPFMQEFYKFQRKRLGILVDKDGEPAGGRWSFDADNRKPWKGEPPAPDPPRGHTPPPPARGPVRRPASDGSAPRGSRSPPHRPREPGVLPVFRHIMQDTYS